MPHDYPPEYDDVDDTKCFRCGAELPEGHEEYTVAFQGFCSIACFELQRKDDALKTIKNLADPCCEVGDRMTLSSCYEVARDALKPKQIAVVNVDTAEYIGDPDDGVYYTVARGFDGKWYGSAIVDSNTGSFVDALVTDDGPYDFEGQAETAMADAAKDWCIENGVMYDNEPSGSDEG